MELGRSVLEEYVPQRVRAALHGFDFAAPESLDLFYASPDKAILDGVARHAGLGNLKELTLRLKPAPVDVAAYQRLVLEHPLIARLETFSISCSWPDPDHRSKVAAWLTPESRPAGSLRQLELQAKNRYAIRSTDLGWTALEVELADAGVGEFAQMAGKLPPGRVRSLRVVGAQKIPDFHRTLVKAVEALGPLEHVELPPAPPGV